MTATDAQVRILMRERKKGRTQEQAAAKANLRSRKTVARYEGLGLLPSQLKRPRAYQTRPDAFAEDWPQIEQMLSDAPQLEAKALFEWLQEQKPDNYQSNQLRTFQRRVARWRALNQPRVATLEQVHEPGEIMELVAQRMQSNIRELEGALNRIVAHADLRGIPLTKELVNTAVIDLLPQRREDFRGGGVPHLPER